MRNPNAEGQPDTYAGAFWVSPTSLSDNGGVHVNSGVSNFAYYLLVNGGSGVNDLGQSYSVSGIGIAEARAIFYLAQTTYLTSSAKFINARLATENAAAALFGNGSNQKAQLSKAWYAVGVGAPPGCTNIAPGKTASASSSSGSNTPSRAVDNAQLSYWASTSGGTQWLQVDLGTSAVSYNAVEILWNSTRYARSYQVRVSNSPTFTTFTTVFSTTTGNGGADNINFAGRTERYIRIHATTPNSTSYRVAEFRVCSPEASVGSFTEQNDGNSNNSLASAAPAFPKDLTLYDNYPNPFNPRTRISFGLPAEAHVTLKVYNLIGEEVATLINERRNAGVHSVVFEAANLPSGVYFSVLQAGEVRQVRRLTLMK
jgi:hypothetical protein